MPAPPSPDAGVPELRALRSVVPRGREDRPLRVVVLVGGHVGGHAGGERLGAWLDELRHDTVVLVSGGHLDLPAYDVPVRAVGSRADLVAELRRAGSLDLFVDLTAHDSLPAGFADHRALVVTVLPHLVRRGAFVHDRLAAPDLAGGPAALVALLDARADIGTLAVTRELVVVTQRRRTYLMLRETDVPEVLVAREPALSVEELTALPEGDFTARTTVHHHGDQPTVPTPAVLHHPRLVTRHYRGPVAMSGSTLMWSGTTILPDSFRWHLADRLGNRHLDDPEGEFARVKPRLVPRRTLEGDFYQLEAAYPSHFGHVLTEVVSRMWGWDDAKRRLPGLRLLFHPRRTLDPIVERAFFAAFGIADDDVVPVTGPVEVTSVVSATPMWHNAEPHYVHPAIADVWRRLGDGLRLHESDVETSSRIFVSRSETSANNGRLCRNLAEVERRFADHGFTILYPERHPLPDQARLFREARVVAGFGGSALFNVMHTRRLEALVVLNNTAYFARNEHLFAAVKGGESHYFWSPPDRVPDDPRSKHALRTSWEFDVARLGGELDRVLTGL